MKRAETAGGAPFGTVVRSDSTPLHLQPSGLQLPFRRVQQQMNELYVQFTRL